MIEPGPDEQKRHERHRDRGEGEKRQNAKRARHATVMITVSFILVGTHDYFL